MCPLAEPPSYLVQLLTDRRQVDKTTSLLEFQ